jgi:ATP-dependent Clp protease adaptor protein ClpS
MGKSKEKEVTAVSEILSMPYVLTLHNDDYNTFDWVIECLISICGHEYEQAAQSAHIVHFKGKCDVKYGQLSVLEKMKNNLNSAGLSATIIRN